MAQRTQKTHKKRGRRIYTYRARNRRIFSPYHPWRSALGTVLLLAVAAGLGVVGYSIAGPLVTRLQAEAEHPTTVPDPYFTDTAPAALTSDPGSTTTTTTVTTPALTVSTTTTTETTLPDGRFMPGVQVICLAAPEAAATPEQLDHEAARIAAAGYTAMLLPMKREGGMLGYSSSLLRARECGATNDTLLSPAEIARITGEYGLGVAGSMRMLADHLYPNVYLDGSYSFKNGTVRWLDNKVEKGGKPWLDPKSSGARSYLHSIAAELTEAGCELILCDGLVYPEFFKSDTERLGKWIQDGAQRQAALTEFLNAVGKDLPGLCWHCDLQQLIAGGTDLPDPAALTLQKVCVDIDFAAFTKPFTVQGQRYDPSALALGDKAALLMEAAELLTGDMQLIPCIAADSLTDAELEGVVGILADAGYSTVLVQIS